MLTVCPGYVKTAFSENAVKGAKRQRIAGSARSGISAERVAAAVLRGIIGRKREMVVPWGDRLVIKLYQNSPRVVEWMMARMLKPAEEANQG